MEKSGRLSRLPTNSKYAPRESVFAGNAEMYRGDANAVCSPFLRECVMAMEDCCDEALQAQEVIREGTADLPRMTTVLQNERVFLLVDEATIRRYKADLTDEIEPQINELLTRAEKGLKATLKKEAILRTKVDGLQQSRPSARATVNTIGMSKLESRRVQMLVKQRERLEEEMQALQAEVDAMEIAAMRK